MHLGPHEESRLRESRADVGVHELKAGEEAYPFAVNALAREESDLRGAESGRWGDWLDETAVRLEYRSLTGLLLLVGLALACVHLLLVARAGRAGR